MHDPLPQAHHLLYEEAQLLDEQRWDEWLARMHPEVVFWVPAWISSSQVTEDPGSQISLIYCKGQQSLRDRVSRIRSGRSPANTPMPRTVHAITNVLVEVASETELRVKSVFNSTVYDTRRGASHAFVGRYEHVFVRTATDQPWLIAIKRVILVNDRIPGMLDFYYV